MDDKRIQQVLDIEKQAEAIYQSAVSQAVQLPMQAENEAADLLEKARLEAEEEARRIVEKATTGEESELIASDAMEKIQKMEAMASMNQNRAVTYVLARVVGRESS